MKTEFHTTAELIEADKGLRELPRHERPRELLSPIDLGVIPNYMGINLCAVEGLSWTKQDDGQFVSLTIHFLPTPKGHPDAP